MSVAARLRVVSLIGALSACSELPSIASNECGNSIIEAGEDCDTFAPTTESLCLPKGAVGECHLSCHPRADLSRPACPAGWGCDSDGICREPTGNFEAPSDAVAVGAWSLRAADFDGDGRGDIVSREPLNAIGATRLRFYYFDAQAHLEETSEFPKLLLSPTLADVSGDGRSDVVFSDGRVGVLLGRRDRSWVPETFSTYRVADARVRVVTVAPARVQDIVPIVPLTTIDGQSGIFTPDPSSGRLVLRTPIGVGVEGLAGDPVAGDLLEDANDSPCWETVFALNGDTTFSVVDSCGRDQAGEIVWRDQFIERKIALVPAAPIDKGPLLADLNGDGHLDVLIGAAGGPYVSYGDGRSLTPARPYQLDLSNPELISPNIPMPIAAGDFTGDGAVDFVFQDHLLLSRLTATDAAPSYSVGPTNSLAGPWTTAVIADLNGNGNLDVVTASNQALDLEFFNGTGGQDLVPSMISTDAPVERLAVGDFDGDLTRDLGIMEKSAFGSERDTVAIAFGTPFGLPSRPTPVAHIGQAEAVSVYRDGGLDNLVVTSTETDGASITGALTFLLGSGDRLPFAPYSLTNFASNGSVQDSQALTVTAGGFSGKGHGDVLSLAVGSDIEFWLVPAIEARTRAPILLPDKLDPSLTPFVPTTLDFTATLVSAAADLNGDGRDEALFAMPAGVNQELCGVLVLSASSATSTPRAEKPVLLHERCSDPQILPVDVDADGFTDLALLMGAASDATRRLLVLWNDGRGGFSAENLGVVVALDSPKEFALLPATPLAPLGFVYVNGRSVELVRVSDAPRQFLPPLTLLDLPAGTGVTAADVNGDGVTDIVLAASGDLSVLPGELRSQ